MRTSDESQTTQPTTFTPYRDLLYNSILSWADNRKKARKKSTFTSTSIIKQCAADLRKDERLKGVSSAMVKDVLVGKGVVK